MAVEGGSDYRQKLAKRKVERDKRFSTAAPKNKSYLRSGFEWAKDYYNPVNIFSAQKRVAEDTLRGGPSSVRGKEAISNISAAKIGKPAGIPGALLGVMANYGLGNIVRNEDFGQAIAPLDVIGITGVVKGAGMLAAKKGVKPAVTAAAGLDVSGLLDSATAEARPAGLFNLGSKATAAAKETVPGKYVLDLIAGNTSMTRSLFDALEKNPRKYGKTLEALTSGTVKPEDSVRIPIEFVRELVRKEGAPHTTGRGVWSEGLWGPEELARVLFGTKGTVEDVAEFYPTAYGRSVWGKNRGRFPVFEPLENPLESVRGVLSQTGFMDRIIKGGVGRAEPYFDLPQEAFSSVRGAPQTLRDIYTAAGETPSMLTPQLASPVDVARGLGALMSDLPGVAAFAKQARPRGGRETALTPPGEHVKGASNTGATVLGEALRLVREGITEPSEIVQALRPTVSAATEALSPTSMPYTTQAYNTAIKGSGSLLDAINASLASGREAIEAPMRVGAKTRALSEEKIQRILDIDPTFTSPEAAKFFAESVKPLTRFGRRTFGTAEDAVDLFEESEMARRARAELAEKLLEMRRIALLGR